MKIKLPLTFIAAALISCSNNSEIKNENESLDVSCFISTSDNGSPDLVKDFSMYVTLSDGFSDYMNVINPIYVTYNSGWKFPQIKVNEPAKVYGFHPKIESKDLRAIQLDFSNQIDFLSTPQPVIATKENPSITLTMNHLLAKIRVTIDNSEDVSVIIRNIPSSANYDLQKNRIKVLANGEISGKSSLMICPFNGELSMSIRYKGKDYEYKASEKKYESGKEYIYKLKIDDSKQLVISDEITVIPWESAGNYEGTITQ